MDTSRPPQRPQHEQPGISDVGRFMGLGMEFLCTVGVPVGVGLWADYRWGLLPLFTLIGLAVGFATGLYQLIRRVGKEKDAGTPGRRDAGTKEE